MKWLLVLWGLLVPFFVCSAGVFPAGFDGSAGFPVGIEMGRPFGNEAGGPGFEEALLRLTGASCVEDLSEEELLRWEALAARPVDLNLAGRSRLLASGLLTPFQVASLLDYRGRTGAVLSWSELALVDGFTAEMAAAMRVFATLGPAASGGVGVAAAPGRRESLRLNGSVTVKGAGRVSVEATPTGSGSGSSGKSAGVGSSRFSPAELSGGVKIEAALGERAALFISTRNTFSDMQLGSPTFSAAYYGRRALGQVVVGHFNARFGQGLVLWSGFRMSGYSSVGAFRRNGNGFSPTGSYSPSLLGVATDWHFGSWRLSVAYSINNKLPIANLTWTGRTATLGLTATSQAAGLEARWSLPGGWSLFSELATDWASASAGGSGTSGSAVATSTFGNWLRSVSAVAGAVRVPSYGHKWAVLGRWFGPGSKEYSGLAVGYAGSALETTLDSGIKRSDGQLQIKSVTQWKPVFELSSGRLALVSGSSSSASTATPSSATASPGIAPTTTSPETASTNAAPSPSPRALLFRPQLRLVARWRPDLSLASLSAAATPSSARTRDLRVESRGVLAAEYGPWLLSGRYDAVWYRSFAWSWYAEAGRKTEAWAVYLRGGIFKVDDWDDRIYVYERDAPGAFTVPARYGRGWNASLYAAWHLPRRAAALPSRHSIWLRIETVQYPWNLTPKPGRLEARLQYRFKF